MLAGSSREEIGGWRVLHLAGTPRQVGYQHGWYAGAEITDAIESVKPGLDKGWAWTRDTAHRLFWDKLDPEYRDEISGIAEGAAAKGVKIDADDVLALNASIEIQGYYEPYLKAKLGRTSIVSKAPLACSAFVATGSITADGKPVMAHNFWWDYQSGERFREILDIKPASGHRIMLDAMPGLIDSATDWAISDAGLGLTETTISNFAGFDEKGLPEFMRMRKAIQYGESLDGMTAILKKGNNGGYANTWLMIDVNTNEIGKLELGLKNVIFSSATDGYFVGSNFPENPKLIAEEAPSYAPKGNNCEQRRMRWIDLIAKKKGQIDVETAKAFISDSTNPATGATDGHNGALCGKFGNDGAVNAKAVDAAMLKSFSFWARLGIPDGTTLPGKTNPGPGEVFAVPGMPWVEVRGR